MKRPKWFDTIRQMFRIARIRIRWIKADQHSSYGTLATSPAPVTDSEAIRHLWTFHSRMWRVHVKWVGSGSRSHAYLWAGGLLVLMLGIFALTRLTDEKRVNHTIIPETLQDPGLVVDELSMNGEALRVAHSSFDIGQSSDLFDQKTATLARGLEANPLLLDLEFASPKPVTGLVMDFGRMDFTLYVEVYSTENHDPVVYEGEYRGQPPEPHIELNFENGPARVKRIYIEIEQLNPPAEPHIHVREVFFKE